MAHEPSGEFDIRWIASNIPDNIMVLDREGRIQYINYTVPDLSPEQVRGRAVFEFVAEPFHEGMRACFARILEAGEPDRYQTQYVSDAGDVSDWESRVAPARRGGAIVGFIVISSNITERLREAAERRRLFDLSRDLLCIASTGGYFKSVNPTFTDVLGYPASVLTAKPLVDFVHPDDRATTLVALDRLAKGEPVDFENRYRTRAGDYRVLSWRAVAEPLLGLIYASARDVTDAKRLEAQLLHAQKMDAVGRLAGGVAHDFNNLLAAIRVNANLAQRRLADHPAASHLVEITRAGDRAAELTRKLLAFARGGEPNPQVLRLDETVADVLAILRRIVPPDIELAFAPAPDVASVLADRGQVEQVVMNLVLNARDALPDGGTIRITLADDELSADARAAHPFVRPGRHVRIDVADSGTGIAPAIRDRIFEPFFTTKPPEAGAGLGLATVYGIAQKHGGLVTVDSTVGVGSTFHVWLPATNLPPATDRAAAAAVAPTGDDDETILVAEDNELVRRVVVQLLCDAGYRVLVAEDGDAALRIAADHRGDIHLALLDVVMPNKDGAAAARELVVARPGAKVLLTSGHADRGALARAGLREDDVLVKPYDPDELLRRIRAALDG